MMRDMVGGAGCGPDGANPLTKMLQGMCVWIDVLEYV